MATSSDALSVLFPNVAITRDIRVRVAVSYLAEQSNPQLDRWFWSYHVRIENGSDLSVQLISRSWRIVDGRGATHEVHGEGVVGETPVLAPEQTHDYVSGCELMTNHGSMQGHYVFARPDGSQFEVAIPFFPLAAQARAEG